MAMVSWPASQVLSDFYGVEVGRVVAAACEVPPRLTADDDLLSAHLRRNVAFAGSLDRTLAGLIELARESGGSWLYDARDSHAVFFHDDETRELSMAFSSASRWLAWRDAEKAAEAAAESGNQPTVVQPRTYEGELPSEPQRRAVGAEALVGRLQWAVCFFAQPVAPAAGREFGRGAGADGAARAIEEFLRSYGTRPWQRLASELEQLRDDAPLACSWLLVAAALADQGMFAQLREHGPRGAALFEAFLAGLEPLAPASSLPGLPDLALFKSQLLIEIASRLNTAEALSWFGRGLEAAPDQEPLLRARLLLELAERTSSLHELPKVLEPLRAHAVADVADALLSLRVGAPEVPAAPRALAALLDSDEPLVECAWLFGQLAPVLTDKQSLSAGEELLEADPYNSVVLGRLVPVAERLREKSAAVYRARYSDLSALMPLLRRAVASADSPTAMAVCEEFSAAGLSQQQLIAQRVLALPSAFHPLVVELVLEFSLHNPWPQRSAAWAVALARPDAPRVLSVWRKLQASPSAETIADLRRVLEDDAAETTGRQQTRLAVAGEVCAWLAASGSEAAHEALIELLEHATPLVRQQVAAHCVRHDGPHSILHKLSDAQAARVARALVAIQRNAGFGVLALDREAGRRLAGLKHSGAEGVLIDSLRGERRAELVSNLYAALATLGTPRAKETLIAQLFAEPRALWRMAEAFERLWDDEFEAAAMHAISSSAGALGAAGANRLAGALAEHGKRPAPLLALGLMVCDWEPTSEEERERIAYVLFEAASVALREERFAESRQLLARAEQLGVSPRSDYHAREGALAWANPFADDQPLSAKRTSLLQGELERQVAPRPKG